MGVRAEQTCSRRGAAIRMDPWPEAYRRADRTLPRFSSVGNEKRPRTGFALGGAGRRTPGDASLMRHQDDWGSVERHTSLRMSRVRHKGTAAEISMAAALTARGLTYEWGTRPLPDIPRAADFVIRDACIAIFVDGCFWHGCQIHRGVPRRNRDLWLLKIARTRQRDAEIDSALAAASWKSMRVWEHDDPDPVADAILRAVRTGRCLR